MWRRIRLIPFLQKFEGTQNDRSLLDKLRAEGAGILNWAIEGCLAWQLEGLEPPAAVQQATKGYREESDVLMPFLDDCCLIDSGAFIESSKLWIAYMKWTERNGERSLARNTFADHLKRRGLTSAEHGHDKRRIWRGLTLRPEWADAGERVDAGAVF